MLSLSSSPRYLGLLCSSLFQIKKTEDHYMLPSIFFSHIPNSRVLGLWLCFLGYFVALPLWFCSEVCRSSLSLATDFQEGKIGAHLSNTKENRFWHCSGKKQRWCCMILLSRKNGGHSQTRPFRGRRTEFSCKNLGFNFQGRISVWGCGMLAYLLGTSVVHWLCEAIPVFPTCHLHETQFSDGTRLCVAYNFSNISRVTWSSGFPILSLWHSKFEVGYTCNLVRPK